MSQPKRIRTDRPRPLPGSRAGHQFGQKDYLVMLREIERLEVSRRAVVQANEARTERFARMLRQWVHDEKLEDQVAAVGESIALPAIPITCTPLVAKRIEQLPEVDAVVPDAADIEFIR